MATAAEKPARTARKRPESKASDKLTAVTRLASSKPAAAVIKEGWLDKRGPTEAFSFDPRWCVLRPDSLEYFEDQACSKKKGSVDLGPTSLLAAFKSRGAPGEAQKYVSSKPHGFVLDMDPAAGRERHLHYFDARSQVELDDWSASVGRASRRASRLPLSGSVGVPSTLPTQDVELLKADLERRCDVLDNNSRSQADQLSSLTEEMRDIKKQIQATGSAGTATQAGAQTIDGSEFAQFRAEASKAHIEMKEALAQAETNFQELDADVRNTKLFFNQDVERLETELNGRCDKLDGALNSFREENQGVRAKQRQTIMRAVSMRAKRASIHSVKRDSTCSMEEEEDQENGFEETLLDGLISLWGYDESEEAPPPKLQSSQRAQPQRKQAADDTSLAELENLRKEVKRLRKDFMSVYHSGENAVKDLEEVRIHFRNFQVYFPQDMAVLETELKSRCSKLDVQVGKLKDDVSSMRTQHAASARAPEARKSLKPSSSQSAVGPAAKNGSRTASPQKR